MKTPRELLLERHRFTEAKLDAIRESVVATIRDPRTAPNPSPKSTPRYTLRGLLSSCRWHLAGLGAAWLVVLLLNIDRSPEPVSGLARENLPTPRQLLASLQAYRRQLMELLERPAPESVAAPPPRRSQLSPPQEVV